MVSEIAPFTEIILDGENGLVAKKDDAEGFARGLQRMLDMNTAQRSQSASPKCPKDNTQFYTGSHCPKNLGRLSKSVGAEEITWK